MDHKITPKQAAKKKLSFSNWRPNWFAYATAIVILVVTPIAAFNTIYAWGFPYSGLLPSAQEDHYRQVLEFNPTVFYGTLIVSVAAVVISFLIAKRGLSLHANSLSYATVAFVISLIFTFFMALIVIGVGMTSTPSLSGVEGQENARVVGYSFQVSEVAQFSGPDDSYPIYTYNTDSSGFWKPPTIAYEYHGHSNDIQK